MNAGCQDRLGPACSNATGGQAASGTQKDGLLMEFDQQNRQSDAGGKVAHCCRGTARCVPKVNRVTHFLSKTEKRYGLVGFCGTVTQEFKLEESWTMSEIQSLDQFVEQQLRSGKYQSYEAMVQAGLRLLQEREQEWDTVADALRPAAEDFLRGDRGDVLDMDAFLAAEHTALPHSRA